MSDRPVPETGPQAADLGLHERRSQDAATDLGVPQGDGPATWEIRQGDALERLREMDAATVQTCITSPPYWGLRDYGDAGQLGLEPTPDLYVENLVNVFREVRRVLRDDGTVWLNLGDSYNAGRDGGHPGGKAQWKPEQQKYQGRSGPNVSDLKPKDLVGIPWRVAFALQQDGWWLRSDIVWNKPNPMPESVTDRPTRSHEYLFLLTKSARYYFDSDAIREDSDPEQEAHNQRYAQIYDGPATAPENGQPGNVNNGGIHSRPGPGGRNKRSVWTVATQPYPGAHFATFPPKLIEPCILAGSRIGDEVLDPFCGAGTTGLVALRHDRSFVGIELNPDYCELARQRIRDDAPLFNVASEAA